MKREDRRRDMPVTVYKLGGSLLDVPDLPERLQTVLAAAPGERPLLVVGGGGAANLVRTWDRLHDLGDSTAHRLAIAAMDLNARVVEELLPRAALVANRGVATACWTERRRPILAVEEHLRGEEAAGADRLPHSWDVTADSIAAWIALRWPADRLVLLKSVPPSPDAVDRYFAPLAARLPCVDWIDLRNDPERVRQWDA